MDQINGPSIESEEEFQIRMNEGRQLMGETMGEVKHELSEALEWKTYVQRHPGTCLLASGALGWILGRRLRSFRQAPLSFSQPELPVQPYDSSTFSRTADKIVRIAAKRGKVLFRYPKGRRGGIRGDQGITGG